jgi:hypothetical protein
MRARLWILVGLASSTPSFAWSQNTGVSGSLPSEAYFPAGQADIPTDVQPAPTTPLVSTLPQPGAPPTYQDVTAGAWSSLRQASGGVTTSGVHGQSDQGDAFFLFAATSAPGYVTLQLFNPAFSAPANTPIHLHVAFDNNVTLDFPSIGQDSTVKAPLGASQLKLWIHGFTAANNMDISFVGSAAAPHSFSLAGTTPTTLAMAECAKEAAISLPAPFNTGAPPGLQQGSSNDQPFASPPTAPVASAVSREACQGITDDTVLAAFHSHTLIVAGQTLIAQDVYDLHSTAGGFVVIVNSPNPVCTGYVDFVVKETGASFTQQATTFIDGTTGQLIIRPVPDLL